MLVSSLVLEWFCQPDSWYSFWSANRYSSTIFLVKGLETCITKKCCFLHKYTVEVSSIVFQTQYTSTQLKNVVTKYTNFSFLIILFLSSSVDKSRLFSPCIALSKTVFKNVIQERSSNLHRPTYNSKGCLVPPLLCKLYVSYFNQFCSNGNVFPILLILFPYNSKKKWS